MAHSKSYRKLFAASATAAVAASALAPAVVSADNHDFSDLQPGDSHYEAVMNLVEQGVIQGYEDGTFGVNEDLSRRHAAVLFANALELDTPEDMEGILENYSDVNPDSLYAEEIAAVTAKGIFNGSSDMYMPLDDLTREQMATVIVLAFGLEDNGEEIEVNLENVSPSHKENVKILAQHGITNQLDDFRPDEAVTRGQFATFLWKAWDMQGDVTANLEIKDGLTAFQRTVEVTLDGTTNPEAYTVKVMGKELEYKGDKFVAVIDSSDEDAIKDSLEVIAPETEEDNTADVDFTVETEAGLTAFQKLVKVSLTDVENDSDYMVSVMDTELEYKEGEDAFVGLVDSTDVEAIKAAVEVTVK